MSQKILFIAPNYFGIQEKIKKCLEKQGYQVFYINDSDNSFFINIIKRIPYIEKKIRFRKREKIEKIAQNNSIDTLFVIRGSQLDCNDWRIFFEHTNIPHKLMYQWDSVRNFDYTNVASLFDKVYTFDKEDSIKYGYCYYPLFFEKVKSEVAPTIDLLFVGIWHSDRIKILNRIYEQAQQKGLSCDFRVYYPWYLYLWLKYVRKKDMQSPFWRFKKISRKEMDFLYAHTRCVVDINHPLQSGLTMRTMETIGNNKKMITTNGFIKQEKFYSSDSIQIIDRDVTGINFSFLDKETHYEEVDCYELTNWLVNMFDNGEHNKTK